MIFRSRYGECIPFKWMVINGYFILYEKFRINFHSRSYMNTTEYYLPFVIFWHGPIELCSLLCGYIIVLNFFLSCADQQIRLQCQSLASCCCTGNSVNSFFSMITTSATTERNEQKTTNPFKSNFRVSVLEKKNRVWSIFLPQNLNCYLPCCSQLTSVILESTLGTFSERE